MKAANGRYLLLCKNKSRLDVHDFEENTNYHNQLKNKQEKP
jgi:hypothetical protein